ncbi:MAG TPA: hypothetical protein VLV78_07160 [Thermoanaerobaculia bacterium]|nr:hypothetical protein [Thermoanaerobaculia bacterium]
MGAFFRGVGAAPAVDKSHGRDAFAADGADEIAVQTQKGADVAAVGHLAAGEIVEGDGDAAGGAGGF